MIHFQLQVIFVCDEECPVTANYTVRMVEMSS